MISSNKQHSHSGQETKRFLPAGGHGLVVNFDDTQLRPGESKDNTDLATRKARALAGLIQEAAKTENYQALLI